MTSSDNQHSVAAAGAQEQAAPGRLDLVRRFVNTQDVEDGIEELATPTARCAPGCAGRRLPDVPAPATRPEMERLIGLRETLRAAAARQQRRCRRRAVPRSSACDAEAARVPPAGALRRAVSVRPGAGRRRLDAVIGELIGIVHEAMADGTWRRLKACRSETCEWAFYDRLAQPLGNLVLDGRVREPRQGTLLPPSPRRRESERHVGRLRFRR